MKVEELMSKPALTCEAHETLDVAAQKMWDHDCGVLPVVASDGRLAGVITDRDICMSAWSQGRPLGAIHVDEAMSKQVFSVKPDQDVAHADKLMADKQVRGIPVVDTEDKPIGIVSVNDLAREAARSGSRITDGVARAVQTLAAICQPRKRAHKAA